MLHLLNIAKTSAGRRKTLLPQARRSQICQFGRATEVKDSSSTAQALEDGRPRVHCGRSAPPTSLDPNNTCLRSHAASLPTHHLVDVNSWKAELGSFKMLIRE
ncbi:uncharacterized protein MYCFIDRAFT_211266 [Pseudocercospora fijiensis CIRAD86]|uniref:Uncharacterized protein n=1 Tax=Pseudocercospora fijiensis (strain CIRAD86) TaxID=383855 RepID=M2ZW24_PSEFD|nr:uncharacterized protein MYCFIDRAFT_211266 [Pseudocercospora fijiensis CIRAD86]EME83204.1 hypothetical protein MYCFIDRAFT_211266 [Pseudocercospora fijiensis CIRAD86]